MKTKKSGERQRVIGQCSHVVVPIKREARMLWWCSECNDYAQKSHMKLQPRGNK